MRLIDADRLLEDKRIEKYYHLKNGDVAIPLIDIKHAPTIEERKKGKWIHDGFDIPHGVDWMHCSVCGRREPHVPAAMTSFCPSCGADMKQGEQENA